MKSSQIIEIIDTHTGGEPTRVVVSGGPGLGNGSIAERRERFAREFDHIRSAVINEPRGSDVMVGALLCEPTDPSCVAGVIFFNNVGVLNMCGHGTIGVAIALAHMGRISPGRHKIETSVGVVGFELEDDCHVKIENVPAYRLAKDVKVDVPGIGAVKGDIAWGGNWFFLVSDHGQSIELSQVDVLTNYTVRLREALKTNQITGKDGAEIDHIELFGPAKSSENHSRNFVLCPGKAYDRSPCGTGTSAKLACLVEDGKLKQGDIWRQESIVGSVFEGSVRLHGGVIVPFIRGSAYVNGRAELILNPNDPFCMGIRA